MKNHEICRWRMHNQRLWGAPFHSAVGVVEGLLAIQAQEVGAARFSIGARAGVAESVVDAALAGGTILRTHVLRPTWHFVAARDLRWLLRLTAPRVRQLSAYQMKKLALDDKIIAKSNAILDKALTKTALSRDDVAAALVDGGVTDPSGLRLSYLLQEAELSALICSGPVQGKQQTWARVVDRVPDDDAVFAASSDDELLARLVGTFFATRGPATIKDCATWASLTTAMVKQGIAACNEGGNGKGKGEGKGEGKDKGKGKGKGKDAAADGDSTAIASFTHGDLMLWHVPATLPDSFDTRRADLVQGYDEITAGLTDSRAVFFDLLKGRAPLDRPPLLHTVLLDGQLFGHWRPQPGKGPHRGKIVVELQLYVPPTKKEDAALDDAIARYAAYLGTAVVRA